MTHAAGMPADPTCDQCGIRVSLLPSSCTICGLSAEQRRDELKPRIERLLAVYEAARVATDLPTERALETHLRYFAAYPLQPEEMKAKRRKAAR